jgi:hypothetical protein
MLSTMASSPSKLLAAAVLLGIAGIHAVMSAAQQRSPLYQSSRYSVWADHVAEGQYSARALSRTEISSTYPAASRPTWKQTQDLSRYPVSRSEFPLLDALYAMSLEELTADLRPDGAFNAGAKWQGVWTRDASYSILLSLAAIQPQAAKASLLHKVKRDRIVQDTGTGGSWPVSTDRVTWALAAWEVYLVTGDRQWLQTSFSIIRNSILDDEQVVIDPATGLARGESSFMDWREQTYPRWMQPVDIYESKCLGTNAVFYRTYRILAEMAQQLGQPGDAWATKADRIRTAMNSKLWMEDRGYYGQYLYGRIFQPLSPRSDALGESLAILFDIPAASNADRMLRSQPLMPYGIPTVYPETPNIPPYHNRSVWPFVQAFWTMAATQHGDQQGVLYGIASIERAAAVFLTNKENFVAETGSPEGTEINSDRQLWSVAGNLAMTYRVLFGMNFSVDGLQFQPVIPKTLGGTRTLTNFRYRAATLAITVKGSGAKVERITLDAAPLAGAPTARVPSTLTGNHTVEITMAGDRQPSKPLNIVESVTAPDTPTLARNGSTLSWNSIEGAAKYAVYRNGALQTTTQTTSFNLPAPWSGLTEIQVAALSSTGVASFLSAPVMESENTLTIPVSKDSEFVTLDAVAPDQTEAKGLVVHADVPKAARYAIAFRYANGSGPLNTDNKCAIRTLFIDGKQTGPIVLPQRGANEWNNWGFSNHQIIQLSAGQHAIELRLTSADTNMNGDVNRVQIAAVVLTPMD